MRLISEEALLSIAKDVTLANGAKHRCIDATKIHELPAIYELPLKCVECKHWRMSQHGTYGSCEERDGFYEADWFCADWEPKGQ